VKRSRVMVAHLRVTPAEATIQFIRIDR
jgi:hypothetical protein